MARRAYHRCIRMLLYLLTRVLTLLTLFWLLRFVWRFLTGWKEPTRATQFSKGKPKAKPIAGELIQDPNCGTYVSADISLKSRVGNRELHFCSRRCQEEFLSARGTVAE